MLSVVMFYITGNDAKIHSGWEVEILIRSSCCLDGLFQCGDVLPRVFCPWHVPSALKPRDGNHKSTNDLLFDFHFSRVRQLIETRKCLLQGLGKAALIYTAASR